MTPVGDVYISNCPFLTEIKTVIINPRLLTNRASYTIGSDDMIECVFVSIVEPYSDSIGGLRKAFELNSVPYFYSVSAQSFRHYGFSLVLG